MEKKTEDGNIGSYDFGFWSFVWMWVGGVTCGSSSWLGMDDCEHMSISKHEVRPFLSFTLGTARALY